MTNPIRPTDDEARDLAQSLLTKNRHAALGVLTPNEQSPMVTRVAMVWHSAAPHLLVSDLSAHTAALRKNPACSLLVGDPGEKGDPLTHPRLTLQCRATDANKSDLRDVWLAAYPKAKLYFDFTDFRMFRLEVRVAHLNGGFGKAFELTPDDLPN